MGEFIAQLRRGANYEQAARAAGFSRSAFHRLRRRDARFAATCAEAIERSAGRRYVAGGRRRALQLRRNRSVRFDARRQARFLSHLAGTCNAEEAAELAGVSDSTVFSHLAKDPDFAEAYQAALQQGYVRLETEAVRQRLEAQRQLREGVLPTGEIAAEFERVMKLLQRYDRRGGEIVRRSAGHGHQRRWTFDEAIRELDRRLRNFGARRLPPPGEDC